MKRILSLLLITSLGMASLQARTAAQLVQERRAQLEAWMKQKQQPSTFERLKAALYNNKKAVAGVAVGSAALFAVCRHFWGEVFYVRKIENKGHKSWMAGPFMRMICGAREPVFPTLPAEGKPMSQQEVKHFAQQLIAFAHQKNQKNKDKKDKKVIIWEKWQLATEENVRAYAKELESIVSVATSEFTTPENRLSQQATAAASTPQMPETLTTPQPSNQGKGSGARNPKKH